MNDIDKLIFDIEQQNLGRNYLMVIRTFKEFLLKCKEQICEITNSEIPTITIEVHIPYKKDKNLLKTEYKNWLIRQGYKELTPSGLPSTVGQYISSIEKIIVREGKESWAHLSLNLDRLLKDYDTGGVNEKFGAKAHRTPINALYRFQEFLMSNQDKLEKLIIWNL